MADNYPELIGRLHSELKRIGCMSWQADSGDYTVYEVCRSPQDGCDTRLKTYTQVLDGNVAPLLDALAKIPDRSGPAGLEQALDEAGGWYWLPQF
ncbi:MAG: hypothetical protein KIT79_10095 [Deltaproteobacteria bacterium]|nr:hypothetical protein [Deltaproteobacteria bacterium]